MHTFLAIAASSRCLVDTFRVDRVALLAAGMVYASAKCPGQEAARSFFSIGGAAGTAAKTISAHDMTVSESIDGKAHRYASRARVEEMLDHEDRLLRERLNASRGGRTRFFTFADTAAASPTTLPSGRWRIPWGAGGFQATVVRPHSPRHRSWRPTPCRPWPVLPSVAVRTGCPAVSPCPVHRPVARIVHRRDAS